ncbi:phage minor structural protein [[Clostridium] sordellii]|uniref:phage tail spike protein n=1 Tax=Paraclostridium sordellii TaxID=1505 RepID=UPI0005E64EF1|nr:phage tail spike protein [Paeniclostridium sordellii]MDU4413066.1 phage tail spike protein [Paeniclostridium sordellii]CEQ06201.1 phage minor structural protein [[Clostridium] sordellii] [Paeniclostridium sordellii]
MIHLYDKNKKKIAGLIDYKDLFIESELQSGEKTLCFYYPKKANYYFDIVEECYIRTKENEYIVKERIIQSEYAEFKCILNLEDIEGKPFSKFESKEQTIDKTLALALAGTGWVVGKCDLKKKRTVRMTNCSSLEIVQEIKKIYRCDIVFNTLSKTIDVYEHLGEDKGTYFIDSLNLKSLSIQGSSYGYFTRLIPIGKDDLKITDINDKKEYVENYQYSNKIKTAYWIDDRYTVKEHLKDDAIAKLNEISKPFRSYSAAILNLAKLNDKYKNILDYKLGDTITLISKEDKFKDKQRIVKIIEFPDKHDKDSVELANTTLCFEDIQTQFQEAADTVENITTDNGTVKGSTIDGIETSQIKDFYKEVIEATNIKAINAKIINLEAQDVTISGQLTAVNAQIGSLTTNVATIDKLVVKHDASITNLNANKASITDLNATNATIQVLEANVGNIRTLVNGNLSSENIQVSGITGDRLNMKTIFVDDANIVSINASKINAGEISTNKVKIKSDDGGIEIIGTTLQFKDKSNKVRIQMGKDTKDNFNFIIRGEDGQSVLIDHTGVKEKAIANDLIKSNMIASNSVGEKQIDYSSFSEGFNKDTNIHTLNATKIKLNNQNQTLDIAFNSLKKQSDDNTTLTENHSTTIGVMQGQINTAINNTKIIKDGKTVLLKDDYNRTIETIDSLKFTIGSHTTKINEQTGKINNVETKVNIVERDLNGITQKVSNTEISITSLNDKVNNIQIGDRNLLLNSAIKINTSSYYMAAYDFGYEKPKHDEVVTLVIKGELNSKKEAFGIFNTDSNSNYVTLITHKDRNSDGLYIKTFKWLTKFGNIEKTNLGLLIYAISSNITAPSSIDWIKLVSGNKTSNNWNPAPEDYQNEITTTNNKLASIETNLSSITSRVSSVETTNVSINGQVSNLSTRMNVAEQKITDASIISIVSSQFYKKGETDSKYASKSQITQLDNKISLKVDVNGVISSINQTAESIKIKASKIDIAGATTIGNAVNGRYVEIQNETFRVKNGNTACIHLGYRTWQGYTGVPEFLMGHDGFIYSEQQGAPYSGTYFGMSTFGNDKNPEKTKPYHSIYYRSRTRADETQLNFYEDGRTRIKSMGAFALIADKNTYIQASISTGLQFDNGFVSRRDSTIDGNLILNKNILMNGQIYTKDLKQGFGIEQYWGKDEYMLRKMTINPMDLGYDTPESRFRTIYASNGIINTSDARLKKNIKPIQDVNIVPYNFPVLVQLPPSEVLTKIDYYNFVKEMPFYTYDYISADDSNRSLHNVGFIAQDIAKHPVGKEFIFKDKANMYQYNEKSYVGVLGVALQKAISEIEKLKLEVQQLRAS